MYQLSYSVGPWSKKYSSHWNLPLDVRIVQSLLNEQLKTQSKLPSTLTLPLKTDGNFGAQTKTAIDFFQNFSIFLCSLYIDDA